MEYGLYMRMALLARVLVNGGINGSSVTRAVPFTRQFNWRKQSDDIGYEPPAERLFRGIYARLY